MRSFVEFLEERDPQLLEGPLDWLHAAKGIGALPDVGISALGGAGKQLLRGTGNIAGGLGRGVAGTAAMFGGKDARKWGLGQIGRGAVQAGKGAVQTGMAPVTGIVRGVQAARDPYSGEIIPTTGKIGQALGWGKEEEKPRPQELIYKKGHGPASEEGPEMAAMMAGQAGDKRALIQQWKSAKGNPELRSRIEDVLKQNWPEWYRYAKQQQTTSAQ